MLDKEIEIAAEDNDNANTADAVVGVNNALVAPAIDEAELVHITADMV